jgi:hypothetical protein
VFFRRDQNRKLRKINSTVSGKQQNRNTNAADKIDETKTSEKLLNGNKDETHANGHNSHLGNGNKDETHANGHNSHLGNGNKDEIHANGHNSHLGNIESQPTRN